MHIEQFIDEIGWSIDWSCLLINLGPLGLYEDIDDARPRARDSCTSYATENTDYLIEVEEPPNKLIDALIINFNLDT